MANTLRIAKSATVYIDLITSSYEFVEADEPTPNIDRQTRSGCGGNGSKLVKRQLVSWSLPITVMTFGADGNARFDVRDTLLADLEAAVAYETNSTDSVNFDGMPRFVNRVVDNQSPADWFQIMDYNVNHTRKRDQNRFVTLAVDLICWPGQKIPDGADLTGLTVTRIMGGIGRVVLGSDGFPVTLGGL